MTESVLSIFDSDSQMGDELMSLTPPHDMDTLFPDLLSITESKPPQVFQTEKKSPAASVEVINQDVSLEQFLTENKQDEYSLAQSRLSEQHLSPRSQSSEEVDFSTAFKCMSKSAIAARENRLKKKQHVETLERNVTNLTSENKELQGSVSSLTKSVKSLQNEVRYLKGIIANQSTLASLLQQIPGTPGIRLSSSECSITDGMDSMPQQERRSSKRKAPTHHDHGYATDRYVKQQKKDSSEKSAGVCLHVSGASVSLEFCSECSRKACSCDEDSVLSV